MVAQNLSTDKLTRNLRHNLRMKPSDKLANKPRRKLHWQVAIKPTDNLAARRAHMKPF